ncbi:murein hydrolase activator EnvC family protein [Marinobacter caseinilyticus]|uniref:murein hydrolase activator EnvC family protein n=1 Tax=Marinobacter caseinilyticus TaxID=2692195 RepID=UPI001F39D667|nr:peptidoglycan DD-metalloendopeptidase family protein [Marinobacter caseinilyticus]
MTAPIPGSFVRLTPAGVRQSGARSWLRGVGQIAVLGLFLGVLTGHAAAEQNVTPAQVEALKDQILSIDKWLKSAERDRSSLEQDLVETDRAISQLTRERRALQAKAMVQTKRLKALQAEQADLNRVLARQRESLKKQIRTAWMEGDAPAVKVLLNEIDPQTISRTMTYYEYLSRDAIERLDAFNTTLRKLKATQQDAQATQVELSQLKLQVEDRQATLRDKKKQRQQTLTALNTDIRDRQSERAALVADRARLEKLLREVEEAIASIPAPNESKPFKALKAKLPWPARGKVIRRFGDSLAHGKLRQNGVLIATAEGVDVGAIHYGRVVFSNWLRGFGLMTIVDHGGGYMSLYGHNSSLLKSPGDWVDAGEPIAVAGQSGGTDDIGVYFEIRYKGKPQNPESWLNR